MNQIQKLEKSLSFVVMIGKSMKPSMGVVNFVWGEEPNKLVVGDIVAFKRGKFAKLIHRIVDLDEKKGLYYIKGDNATEIDCVPLSDIIFKVNKFRKII